MNKFRPKLTENLLPSLSNAASAPPSATAFAESCLSSLEGAAVTHIRIKGADHEFSSLPGVMEDVTDIILNIKALVVKLDADEPKEMKISVKKAGAVTAGMIEADPAITVTNKDLVIATLTEDRSLSKSRSRSTRAAVM